MGHGRKLYIYETNEVGYTRQDINPTWTSIGIQVQGQSDCTLVCTSGIGSFPQFLWFVVLTDEYMHSFTTINFPILFLLNKIKTTSGLCVRPILAIIK